MICCLCRLSLSKIVNNLLVWIRLLNIVIVKINNCVAIWESLSAHSIAKDYFLLAIEVGALHFTIVADDLVLYLSVWLLLVVVLMREFHLVVLFLVFEVLLIAISWQIWRFLIIIMVRLLMSFANFREICQRVISAL